MIVKSRHRFPVGPVDSAGYLGKKFGIQEGGPVILEEKNGEIILKAVILETELYSDAQIAEWDHEDQLTASERAAIVEKLGKSVLR